MPTTLEGWMFWVISVFVVGFLVNLAASYAKPGSDSLIFRIDRWRRNRSEKRKHEFHKAVMRVVTSDRAMVSMQHRHLHATTRELGYMVLGWLFVLSAYVFLTSLERDGTLVSDLLRKVVVGLALFGSSGSLFLSVYYRLEGSGSWVVICVAESAREKVKSFGELSSTRNDANISLTETSPGRIEMGNVGDRVSVGSTAPDTAQYAHTACTNTIIVNKGEKMPPCQLTGCPNKGADWRLSKKLT